MGNIERESDLSGETHDKGVLILEGYLRNRYARAHPLALSASLAFEQSYGWVEGDSASLAELLCLLNAVAAVGEGRFHLWAVDSVDDAIELLTGMPAGGVDREGTFHHRLDRRLRDILDVLQKEPAPEAAPSTRLPSGKGPKPAPPPLRGERS